MIAWAIVAAVVLAYWAIARIRQRQYVRSVLRSNVERRLRAYDGR